MSVNPKPLRRYLRRLAATRAAAIKAGMGAKAARIKRQARVVSALMRSV